MEGKVAKLLLMAFADHSTCLFYVLDAGGVGEFRYRMILSGQTHRSYLDFCQISYNVKMRPYE
jgi:hypothetical protein